jgi:hypothetical protein
VANASNGAGISGHSNNDAGVYATGGTWGVYAVAASTGSGYFRRIDANQFTATGYKEGRTGVHSQIYGTNNTNSNANAGNGTEGECTASTKIRHFRPRCRRLLLYIPNRSRLAPPDQCVLRSCRVPLLPAQSHASLASPGVSGRERRNRAPALYPRVEPHPLRLIVLPAAIAAPTPSLAARHVSSLCKPRPRRGHLRSENCGLLPTLHHRAKRRGASLAHCAADFRSAPPPTRTSQRRRRDEPQQARRAGAGLDR